MERDLRKVSESGSVWWKGREYRCDALLGHVGDYVFVTQRQLNYDQLSLSFRTAKSVRNRRRPDEYIGRILLCLN